MIRLLLISLVVLMSAAICFSYVVQLDAAQAAKIETSYDNIKDQTTVRLDRVQISGEKDKYHSLHMLPSFSFKGREPKRPSIIDFELQTVVKARLLDSDLYVVFMIDGEKVFLSSSRSAIMRPVPGRRWIGERLVFRMPYEVFVRITKAKTLEIRFERVLFEVGEPQLEMLRKFAEKIP